MNGYQDAEHVLRCMSSASAQGNSRLYNHFKNDLLLFYPERYHAIFGTGSVQPVMDTVHNTTRQENKVVKSPDMLDIAMGVGLGVLGADIIGDIFD